MKSDLYSYSYGNNDNMVELNFETNAHKNELGEIVIDINTYKITENEILEIAEKIKAKRNNLKDMLSEAFNQ